MQGSVDLRRPVADTDFFHDLLVDLTSGRALEYVHLAVAETLKRLAVTITERRGLGPSHQLAHNRRMKHLLTQVYRTYRAHEFFAADTLQKIYCCPCLEQGKDELLIVVCRVNKDGGIGQGLFYTLYSLDTVEHQFGYIQDYYFVPSLSSCGPSVYKFSAECIERMAHAIMRT